MSIFDVVLLFVIGGFGLFGLWFGLISALGSLLGTVVGVFLATRYFAPLADKLMSFTGWTGNFSKVVMFVVAFLLINRLVGFIFYIVGRILHVFTHLPIIHGFNNILGLIFGLAEGVIVVGIILFFVTKYPFWPLLSEQMSASKVVPYCMGIGTILWPLIPEGLKLLQSHVTTR